MSPFPNYYVAKFIQQLAPMANQSGSSQGSSRGQAVRGSISEGAATGREGVYAKVWYCRMIACRCRFHLRRLSLSLLWRGRGMRYPRTMHPRSNLSMDTELGSTFLYLKLRIHPCSTRRQLSLLLNLGCVRIDEPGKARSVTGEASFSRLQSGQQIHCPVRTGKTPSDLRLRTKHGGTVS